MSLGLSSFHSSHTPSVSSKSVFFLLHKTFSNQTLNMSKNHKEFIIQIVSFKSIGDLTPPRPHPGFIHRFICCSVSIGAEQSHDCFLPNITMTTTTPDMTLRSSIFITDTVSWLRFTCLDLRGRRRPRLTCLTSYVTETAALIRTETRNKHGRHSEQLWFSGTVDLTRSEMKRSVNLIRNNLTS